MIKIVTWLADWDKRTKVVLDKDQFGSTETNFTVKVEISSTSGQTPQDLTRVFDEIGGNYLKIAVTDESDNQLYVEVDEWWSGSEEAWIWVKVPSASSSVDTNIYLYYDNSKSDNTTYVGIVDSSPAESAWDANHAMVLHLSDVTTSTVKDSTSNDNDGAKDAANGPLEKAGNFAMCQDFDGSDDEIIVPDSASLSITGDITLEAYLNYSGDPTAGEFYAVMKKRIGSDNSYHLVIGDDGLTEFAIDTNTHLTEQANDTDLEPLTWPHLTCVWDGTDTRVYLNGSLDCTPTATGGVMSDTVGDLRIGWYPNAAFFDYYTGDYNELRIHNVARDADWINSNYQSLNDNVCTFAAEETYPTGAGVKMAGPYSAMVGRGGRIVG